MTMVYVVLEMLVLPDPIVNLLTEEAALCLKSITTEPLHFPTLGFSDDQISLTQNFTRANITLNFLHYNRDAAILGRELNFGKSVKLRYQLRRMSHFTSNCGGSKDSRLLQAKLQEFLERNDLDKHLDADEAIVLGLALHAANLSDGIKLNHKLRMVDGSSYGFVVELNGPDMLQDEAPSSYLCQE